MPGNKARVLRKLTRLQAWLLLLALLAACIASAISWQSAETASPETRSAPQSVGYSDVRLYRDIAAAVANGDGYYPAAARLHRAHDFPTVPFFTVRLPTLAMAAATFGWSALHGALAVLLLACAFAWYARLEGEVARSTQLAALVCLVLGGAMVTQTSLIPQHDQWVGLLLTTALAFLGGRAWPVALVCAAAALAIRELAIAFALLALALAAYRRDWRQTAAWGVLVAAFGVAMALHAAAVQAQVQPGDLHTPGWSGMRGPIGTVTDIVQVSLLNAAPRWLAAPLVVLALFGWTGAPPRLAAPVMLWLLGFGAAIALFARTANLYWAIELVPLWFIGLAFLPRALADVRAAIGGRGKRS